MYITRICMVTILLVTVSVMTGGCTGGDSQETAQKPAVEIPAVETSSTSETPKPELVDGGFEDNTGSPPEEKVVSVEPPSELSAAHILIMHKDSDSAPEGITRTKEEALALAKEIALKSQAEGADFGALAKEYSDGPSGPDGGNLGNFAPYDMVAEFSQVTMKLAIGGVSDPVETQFGFHIIRRQQLQIILKASAKHILIMYAGSMRAPESVTRTKEEALTLIQGCLARYRQGEKFEDLAIELSDGPTGPRGGDLEEFPQGAMDPAFDQATFACEVGKVTDIVETPFGYHIIYRYK